MSTGKSRNAQPMKEFIGNGYHARLAKRFKDGKLITYTIDIQPPAGPRERRGLKTTDLKEAIRRFDNHCETFPVDREGGKSADPLLRAVIAHYVDTYLPNANRAERTIAKASQVLYEFQRFAASRRIGRMSQVTPALVDEWVRDLREVSKAAPKSIKGRLGLLRACLNIAVDAGLLDKSPVRKWVIPKVPDPEIWPLTPSQLREVLDIVRELDIAHVVAWMALTGNRPSDAVALRWRQVDLDTLTVHRTQCKTKKLSKYDISPSAAAVLERERARGKSRDLVFTDARGNSMSTSKVYHDFTRALIAAKFERAVNLKDLRHTFGSIMANKRPDPCPLPVLQILMGHADIQTTMKYVRAGSAAAYVASFGESILPENVAKFGSRLKKAQ